MTTETNLSQETELYFQARRSLILSNGDKEFKDKAAHSDQLVLDVIDSFSSVFIEPMLARAQESC